MKYQLVLWDFDGTLADTLSVAVEFFNEQAEREGWRPILNPQQARELHLGQIIRQHGVPLRRLPSLVWKWYGQWGEVVERCRLFPGVAEVLRRLRSAGCVLGVLSSNVEACIRGCLRHNQVEDVFAFVEGGSPLFGKARRLRRALKRSPRPLRSVLYVGDEARDVEAAREVGVDVAAVTWGLNSENLLRQFAPTYLVRRPDELLEACGCSGAEQQG